MDLETFETEKQVSPLLKACTVFLLLAYSWLAAHALEPQFPEPPELVNEVRWFAQDESFASADFQSRNFFETFRIEPEVRRAQKVLATLGGLKKPVLLAIVADQPQRYAVTHERIEMGIEHAQTPGLLARAFVKAWLYQKADPAILSSLFRLNVVADALTMISQGQALDVRGPWIEAAASYARSCEADWQPLELGTVCGKSNLITPFSFRPLVVSMIVRAQARLPLRERIAFLEAWTSRLQSGGGSIQTTLSARDLKEWASWLRTELAVVAPVDTRVPSLAPLLKAEEARVFLDSGSRVAVDYAFRTELGGDARGFQNKPYLVISPDGARLEPGQIELSSEDLAQVSAHTLVWESCAAPRLSALLGVQVKSSRLMYVRACNERGHGWPSLLRGGLMQFAKEQPVTPFVQLRRDQIALALQRGEMSLDAPVSRYMLRGSPSRELGLQSATFKRDIHAYRALGAIEAVEWFREGGTL